MTSEPMPLRVDIVSDVVCPWCIIGYRQLSVALEAMPGVFSPQVHWQPFELNPDMPSGGQDLREHMRQKYGVESAGRSAGRSRLEALGKKLGFEFDYFEGMRMVNTFAAHQLLHWAGLEGRQTALKMALFAAFFQRREDVSDIGLLPEIAARAGLDATKAADVLRSERYAVAVRESQAAWREREVHAVPMFFFQDKYFVPGAQEASAFERVLARVHARETAPAA